MLHSAQERRFKSFLCYSLENIDSDMLDMVCSWQYWDQQFSLCNASSFLTFFYILKHGHISSFNCRAGRINQVLYKFKQWGKICHFRAGCNKRAGRKYEQKIINKQALIRASRLEKSQKFSLRACLLNRHTRVRTSLELLVVPKIHTSHQSWKNKT